MQISERINELPESSIVKLLKIAEESKDIISLGPGEPDFVPDKKLLEFTCKKLKEGYTHYSPSQGRKELLKELAKKLKKENKISVNESQIIVTCGSQEAIFLAFASLVDPGESVLIPDPGFLSYRPCIELLNGSVSEVQLKKENGFQISYEQLENAITNRKRTRILIINSPSNPTGTIFNKKTLEKIADFAIENNLIIFSDEAYEKFIFKGKHISIASLNGMSDRTVSFHSFSKSFGMPGFRIGYASGPEEIIKAMLKIHPYTTLCSPTISQVAAAEALKNQKWVEKIIKDYNKRRKFIHKRINEIKGFDCIEPEGAFYAFPEFDFKKNGKKFTSFDFCKWLLKNAKVSCVPGTEFGKLGEGFLRLSYATAFDKIEEGMNRIENAVEKLK